MAIRSDLREHACGGDDEFRAVSEVQRRLDKPVDALKRAKAHVPPYSVE